MGTRNEGRKVLLAKKGVLIMKKLARDVMNYLYGMALIGLMVLWLLFHFEIILKIRYPLGY